MITNNGVASVRDVIAQQIKSLQGTWKQIGYEKDGEAEPLDELGWEPRLAITGDKFVVTLANGRIPFEGTYKLDPTRQPKAIDWTDAIGEDAGKTLLGIYSLEGDRFVFCVAAPVRERPAEFRTQPGQVLRVNRREIL